MGLDFSTYPYENLNIVYGFLVFRKWSSYLQIDTKRSLHSTVTDFTLNQDGSVQSLRIRLVSIWTYLHLLITIVKHILSQ